MKSAKKCILHIGLVAAIVLLVAGCERSQSAQEPSELKPAEEITVREDVLLKLSEEEGKHCLTVTNQGQEPLNHGNAGTALLQVNRDGTWYVVPMLPDWGYTLEGYTLKPGQSYSGAFFWDAYGELPDGDYRLAFGFNQDYPDLTYAVTEFSLEDGAVTY